MQRQVDDALNQLENKLVPSGPDVVRYTELPYEGLTDERIKEILKGYVIL